MSKLELNQQYLSQVKIQLSLCNFFFKTCILYANYVKLVTLFHIENIHFIEINLCISTNKFKQCLFIMEWAADGTLKKHAIFPCQFHRILTLHTAGCVYS